MEHSVWKVEHDLHLVKKSALAKKSKSVCIHTSSKAHVCVQRERSAKDHSHAPVVGGDLGISEAGRIAHSRIGQRI